VDNGLLELYGGLERRHLDRRRAHALKSRLAAQLADDGDESADEGGGPPCERKLLGIEAAVEEIGKEQVRARLGKGKKFFHRVRCATSRWPRRRRGLYRPRCRTKRSAHKFFPRRVCLHPIR